MTQLLKYIVKFLSALFDDYGFYIKESSNSGNRFSGASILLASGDVEIFLAIERDEITAYFRSTHDLRKNNWYSSEIILSFLGHRAPCGVLDESTSTLIRNEIPRIVGCLRKSEAESTLVHLDEIEKHRSKQTSASTKRKV
ncbi:MAG: hypothetical protein KKH12_13555 [Gammaproteobacteria bacterium]|nr:hypothetical protein [Gammaproteobacteria bacterium]MBU1482684.1 hypothetical protein [Gammaproteobacteria bacterium]